MVAYTKLMTMPEATREADALANAAHNSAKPECRVLMVFSVLGVGGAETWLMALLRYFHEVQSQLPVRLKIDICLTGGMKGAFDDEAESLGARLFRVLYTRKQLPSFVRSFRKILSQGRYHAIHDHQDYTAGLHLLFGVGVLPSLRIAHVHNSAGNIAFFSKTFVRHQTLMMGKRCLSYFATHVMGTSRQILSEYGFDDQSFKHIDRQALHCGFDTERFAGDRNTAHQQLCHEFGWPETAQIVLFAGRLSSNYNVKNPQLAIDIGRKLIAEHSDVRLVMAGGGDDYIERLRQQVEQLGLSEKILLVGERNDLARIMLGANLFLLPSLSEGLGMVAVEAQAAGLPVLASDTVPRECVVLPEMVSFQSLKDDVSAWADTAMRILRAEHPDAAACNLSVKNSAFAIENSAARLLELYTGHLGLKPIRT